MWVFLPWYFIVWAMAVEGYAYASGNSSQSKTRLCYEARAGNTSKFGSIEQRACRGLVAENVAQRRRTLATKTGEGSEAILTR